MAYWENQGFAKVAFSTDPDVTTWKETVYQTIQIPVQKERVVSDVKEQTTIQYVTVLEWLMRLLGVWPFK